jgi:hypothetical protein
VEKEKIKHERFFRNHPQHYIISNDNACSSHKTIEKTLNSERERKKNREKRSVVKSELMSSR